MKKYSILLGYFAKQLPLIERLKSELLEQDLSDYACQYVFALKTQQFYTAVEDLLKQVAKAFENHIEELGGYHKELLKRLYTEVPDMRPALLSDESFLLLDKVRAFRHFIRHAYDCDLDEQELRTLADRITQDAPSLEADFSRFRSYVETLAS